MKYHFKNDTKINDNNQYLYYKVLKKISKNHQSFYVRYNGRSKNVKFGVNYICPYLEVSYIIKKGYEFIKNKAIYPISEFEFEDVDTNIEKSVININILNLFN